jgi:hypothetical protein
MWNFFIGMFETYVSPQSSNAYQWKLLRSKSEQQLHDLDCYFLKMQTVLCKYFDISKA